jgi:hypothetical protein
VKEQRICVKFCFKVRKTAAETHTMLHEACTDDASSQNDYEWFKRFKNGSTPMDEDDWSCRSSASRSKPLMISQVKNIPGNHHLD